ncbi:hypothetical protein [Pimelobacter sp. 30-1]|uniref:hypothetical protein n=1 Tax=Pimelobacter sp. 30-1 TaxID=2004991 RepID=UPI001C03D566|nr:hypothetical protein [Pimelobacter sp. 30-1]MBU2698609.1 hypothetical protein [Pimelobacter sp. 30-1]
MLRLGLTRTLALVSLIIAASACSSAPEGAAPTRFTIRPDDYHVPYAGTAADGRRFFLSPGLFDAEQSYVGLFLWNADGSFDEVLVDRVDDRAGVDRATREHLAALGDYTLEPIEVEPFTTEVDGVTFGWEVSIQDEDVYMINIEPGDFIAYFEPWDGVEYDT